MFLFVVMAESEKTLCGFCHQGKEWEIDCGTLYIHLEKDRKTAAHKMCMVCSIMRFLPSATKLRQVSIFRSVCQEFCPQGGCLPQCMLGYTPWADTPSPPPPPPRRRLLHRTVRILLECIPVLLSVQVRKI